MIRIAVNHSLARALLILLAIAAFLTLSVRIGKNCLADQAAQSTETDDLNRAIELDPGNAEYHLRLARVALYSVADANPELAMEQLSRTAKLSPRNVQVWLELAAASGFQGKSERAEFFLRRADMMAPQIPAIQWVVGNFFLLQGNTDEAFKHFRTTLAGTYQYDRILFRTAWKASGDGAKILTELVPSRIGTEISYLYYLVDEEKFTDAMDVWKRIAASSQEFEAAAAARFLNRLLLARMPTEAAQVWNDLIDKGLLPPIYEPNAENAVVNGNFEDDLFNAGFDWRIRKTEDVEVLVDGGTSRSPSHSIRVKFNGESNINFGHLYQYVRVEPNRKYRLQGFLKTDGITTDSGLRLRVMDAYDPNQLLDYSENYAGTTPSWTQVNLDFKTGPQTRVVLVALARLPSRKLDNQIAGTAWLDDVSLAPIP